MYEVIELLAVWVRERSTRNAVGFLVFVVLPALAALAAFVIVVGQTVLR